jgi:hypothetical protein
MVVITIVLLIETFGLCIFSFNSAWTMIIDVLPKGEGKQDNYFRNFVLEFLQTINIRQKNFLPIENKNVMGNKMQTEKLLRNSTWV